MEAEPSAEKAVVCLGTTDDECYVKGQRREQEDDGEPE